MVSDVREVPALVAGQYHSAGGGEREPIPDPADGQTIAVLPYSSASEIDAAVAAAKDALGDWALTPPPERAQIMFRYKVLLEQHLEELTRLVTRENGKTLAEARGEVRRGIEVVDFACGAPTLLTGGMLPQIARGIDEDLTRHALGVVAGITPFNFPAMIPLWMIPMALVCGNTFVLKPSPRTPLSSVRLAELLGEAGLPDGVLNIVHGGKEAVDALIAHPDVVAVSFVGSAGVARAVYREAAAQGKRVQALGGAKNHLVVMDDADLESAVPNMIGSAFGCAGQRCLAGSVAVGVGPVADDLVRSLAEQAEALTMGAGIDPQTELGPVIREQRRRELLGYVEQAAAGGATLVLDGRGAGPDRGYFLGATIFDEVTPEMPLWQEELFGPVLGVARVPSIDDAIELVNRSRFGNTAVIFTNSGKNAREFRQRAQAGMIGVNVGVPAPMAFFPFGGWKDSFFGDLHATGMDAVLFYTATKVTVTRWP